MGNYRKTLNMHTTEFPMRANLSKREPAWLRSWESSEIYKQIRKVALGRKKFILHDGPPYANGKIHIGHAVNKILKDIILKSKTLDGFDAPYIPGWDCHGLPIEHQIEKTFGKKLSPSDFRKHCREFAERQIEFQRKDFMRLGVLGDWENPYKTMDFKTEAEIIRALGTIYKKDYLKQGVKPVFWCSDCGSALAEAEVEYKDKVSRAIDVAFQLNDTSHLARIMRFSKIYEPVFAVIWTTTPWTLPSNRGVAVNSHLSYSLVRFSGGLFLLATDLVDSCMQQYQISEFETVGECSGEDLEGILLDHPFYERLVPILQGGHVTTETGTGLVHTAPAHGVEDFDVGLFYDLKVDSLIDDGGVFHENVPFFGGLHFSAADKIVIEELELRQRLIRVCDYVHSYPVCWRHKSPVIYRATPQWFISMDDGGKSSIRNQALEAIDGTNFYPHWGLARLKSMVLGRPDWCVSRQRDWGTPMPFFRHKDSGELHPSTCEILERVARKVEDKGIDAWFEVSKEELLGADAKFYEKVTSTMDVWFDSGTTHLSVLGKRRDLNKPADLYLEGSDQHRGWFQSSLLTGCAIDGRAPYKGLLTHGFVVDGEGKKMSKSMGNVISPQKIIDTLGADVLRLWVGSTDYSGELTISNEILQRVVEAYRRIRNTLRFILANLEDYHPEKNHLTFSEWLEIDRYALQMLAAFQQSVLDDYEKYEFHQVVRKMQNFCSEDLGGFYLDILKDRLYTMPENSKGRRSAQNALFHLGNSLIRLVAPIISFTAEEAWSVLQKNDQNSVFLKTWHDLSWCGNDLIEDWHLLREVKDKTQKAIENKRENGSLGSSLEAVVHIEASESTYSALTRLGKELRYILLASEVTLQQYNGKEINISVSSSPHRKCERCWHYTKDVGYGDAASDVCQRCAQSMKQIEEKRVYA